MHDLKKWGSPKLCVCFVERPMPRHLESRRVRVSPVRKSARQQGGLHEPPVGLDVYTLSGLCQLRLRPSGSPGEMVYLTPKHTPRGRGTLSPETRQPPAAAVWAGGLSRALPRRPHGAVSRGPRPFLHPAEQRRGERMLTFGSCPRSVFSWESADSNLKGRCSTARRRVGGDHAPAARGVGWPQRENSAF